MALRGTNQEFGRPYNRRIVLETIRLHGPITRADIAKRVGLTLQTVSTIAAELETKGLVAARSPAVRGRGFPAPTLEINAAGGYAIGLHLTQRGIEVALVDMAGTILAKHRHAAPHLVPADALQAIRDLVSPLVAGRAGLVLGIGVAMPGPFEVETMSFVGPTTLEGWKGVAIRDRLEDMFGFPVFIAADMQAAATGERMYGIGAGIGSFYYLYFGVGLGGAMIENGLMHRGAWGNAGEIGHVVLVPGGEACPCGNRGCLERYVSLDAYDRRGRAGGHRAFAAEVAPILRTAVVAVENLYDPETIVMGGLADLQFLKAMADALVPLPNSIAARPNRSTPRVVVSESGPDAVLRGAAAVAVSGALSPRIELLFPPGTPVVDTTVRRAGGRRT